MKILLNVSNINVGGGTQVALSFIHSLSKFRQHDFHVFASEKVHKQIHFGLLDKKIKVSKVDFGIKEWIIGKTKMMRELITTKGTVDNINQICEDIVKLRKAFFIKK